MKLTPKTVLLNEKRVGIYSTLKDDGPLTVYDLFKILEGKKAKFKKSRYLNIRYHVLVLAKFGFVKALTPEPSQTPLDKIKYRVIK